MVEKRGDKYCVLHGHAMNLESTTDKPIGAVIKCFDTKEEAEAMHKAIIISEAKREIRAFNATTSKEKYKGFIPPSYPTDMPAEAVLILKATYASVRQKWVDNNPDDRENQGNKESAASIAWGAVKKQYRKNKDGKWIKVQAFQKRTILAFTEMKLSQEEILKNIPDEDLQKIKSVNPHPYFRAYSIAHEGTFSPMILGEGYKKITWTRKAIQSLKNIVIKGIKFFKGHNEDNSTVNRESFGTVVNNFEKEIDGKIHHIVIGYFQDKSSVVNDDIISMEADWKFINNAGRWIADKIEGITGIALGNSETEKPAFTKAQVLGTVQANLERETKMEITFQDVVNFCKERNVWPSQIYSIDQIKADREFMKHFIDFETKEKKFNADITAIEAKAKAAEEKLKIMEGDYNKQTAKTRLDNHLKTNNISMTEKEKIFVDSQFKTLSDYSDDSLKKFVDTSRDLYKEMASKGLFGDKENPVDIGTKSVTTNTNPAENEFIIPD